MSAFQTAQLYEVLGNRGGRLEGEGPFLLEALARAPSRRVADVASGLGLHAHWLAEHDAEVSAFDLSESMIRHAQKTRPHPRVTYRVGDMCHLAGGPYGMVLCIGNSLSLLPHTEELRRFFQSARKALAPGGLLITQTLNYDAPALQAPRIRIEKADLPKGEVVAVKRFRPGEDRTELAITYYTVTGGALMEITECATLRHWSKTAMQACASEAGLDVEGFYGGYEGIPLHEGAPDILACYVNPTDHN